MKYIHKLLSAAALVAAFTLSGCSSQSLRGQSGGDFNLSDVDDIFDYLPDDGDLSDFVDENEQPITNGNNSNSGGSTPSQGEDESDQTTNQQPSTGTSTDTSTTQQPSTGSSAGNSTNTSNGTSTGNSTTQQPSTDTSNGTSAGNSTTQQPSTGTSTDTSSEQNKSNIVTYIKVTGDSVNLRKGAGTSYTSLGTAEKNTLYASLGKSGGWYKTYYKNSIVYISEKYCTVVQMTAVDQTIEKVIAEGTKCLGVKYVYGATRYHDGNGNKLSGFTTSAFDCSSLMQYIFYMGASVNLQVTTRTQIYQGTTVKRSQLKRGDLIFFTNASRKNNSGIERVGHVALYLGDNYILHTASDYAKIEQISTERWGYYIQANRMI